MRRQVIEVKVARPGATEPPLPDDTAEAVVAGEAAGRGRSVRTRRHQPAGRRGATRRPSQRYRQPPGRCASATGQETRPRVWGNFVIAAPGIVSEAAIVLRRDPTAAVPAGVVVLVVELAKMMSLTKVKLAVAGLCVAVTVGGVAMMHRAKADGLPKADKPIDEPTKKGLDQPVTPTAEGVHDG